MAYRIQVAGGLAIYRYANTNFRNILVPNADTLLLTGDCLITDRENHRMTHEFLKYLERNWKKVIYIPGRSELRSPGMAVTLNSPSNIIYSYRTNYPLDSTHILIGATYTASTLDAMNDTTWLANEAKWVSDTIDSEVRKVIMASYYPVPCHSGLITAIVHGDGPNQFKKGTPITNRYSEYSGELRPDYNPEFVLDM